MTETSEARANLRTAIWAVRQAWGAAGVHLDGQRNLIGLLPSEVWVDAIADPPVGEPLPEGELLPELDDDWLDAEREHYRRRQLLDSPDWRGTPRPPGITRMRHGGRLSDVA